MFMTKNASAISILLFAFAAASFSCQLNHLSEPQHASATTAEQRVIRQQIAEMIHQALKASTINLKEGVVATTVPLLSPEDYAKVRQFGDAATPVLCEYLASKNYFEQLLAIRLLDTIGTNTAKDVLDSFAEKAELPATRMYALEFVAIAQRTRDIEILEKIAAADPNINVRTKAIDVIQRYNLKRN